MSDSLFTNWCMLNGCQAVPAAPHMVARFVADIAPLGIDKVWPQVQAISRAHYTIGLADPTLGNPVTAAVNAVSNIEPPQSWNKDHKSRFLSLPYDVQVYVKHRETQRDRALCQQQTRLAILAKEKQSENQQATAARRADQADSSGGERLH